MRVSESSPLPSSPTPLPSSPTPHPTQKGTRPLPLPSPSGGRLDRIPHIWYGGSMNLLARARWAEIEATEGTLELVCQRIAEGEPLRGVAAGWGIPTGQMVAWLLADEGRAQSYYRASEIAAHVAIGEVVGIADTGEDVARDKLRIETRFKLAAAHAKGRYGSADGASAPKVQIVVQRGVKMVASEETA